jgi:collagenase-like PrtC family protease
VTFTLPVLDRVFSVDGDAAALAELKVDPFIVTDAAALAVLEADTF